METQTSHSNQHVKFKVLVCETNIILLVLCGIVATILTTGILLYATALLNNSSIPALIENAGGKWQAIGIVTVLLIGTIGAQIRRFEYLSLSVSFKHGELFKINQFILYIFFFFLLLFPALFHFLELWIEASNREVSAVLPVLILITVMAAWLFRNLWDIAFRGMLSLVSPIDWQLHADRERFNQMLRLKFSEVVRYQGPLSLMMIGIRNIDELRRHFSKKRIQKMQLRIIDFINASVRHLDLVGRVEEGRFIAALLHTAGADARIPAERIIEQMKNLAFFGKKNDKVGVSFCFGIASYEQNMETENELLEKSRGALDQALESDQSIVYL